MKPLRQIVALGGGGFSMEPENPLLDRYLLSLVPKERPKICFIGTASGDVGSYQDKFRTSMAKLPCEPSVLSLFKAPVGDLRDFVMSQDIFYVGGGNTRNLLVLWREWGLDRHLREAYEAGKIMAGISAGAICWFEEGLSDSVSTGQYRPLRALGWLPGSFCPHYDGEARRRGINSACLEDGSLQAGWAADDGVALHFINDEVHRAVASHPERRAYRVSLVNGQAQHQDVEPAYLGGTSVLVRRAALRDIPAMHEAHMRSIREVCSREHTPEEIAGWGNRPLTEDFARRRAEMLRSPKVHSYVVEAYGRILGSGLLRSGENSTEEAHIYGLYLLPEALGKGHGKTILSCMEAGAREDGAKFVTLESTLNARKFYESQGYQPTGEMITQSIGGSPVRAIPMKKVF
jgi:dipeptidase E